jgi:hypothetical protein
MTIAYEVYLDCIKVGLVPNPEEIVDAEDICSRVDCTCCPITNIVPCWDTYLEASKKYYPKALKENPEYLL